LPYSSPAGLAKERRKPEAHGFRVEAELNEVRQVFPDQRLRKRLARLRLEPGEKLLEPGSIGALGMVGGDAVQDEPGHLFLGRRRLDTN